MARIARALRHRNYRLFFFGQAISVTGTWLTRFATAWMAYRLTDSGFLIGLVAFCGQAPMAAILPLAGALVDRWDLHRTVLAMQVAGMVQSAALAAFAFTGTMTVWHLMALGAVQGVINAFEMPARQSYIRDMIEDRADLPNAIALSSSMLNAARLVGPAIGTGLLATWGAAWCFAVDAASYLAVIGSLLAMRVNRRAAAGARAHVWGEMVEGFRYVAASPLVAALLVLLAVSSVLAGANGTLLPLIAREELAYGELVVATGAGALLGALFLAHRQRVRGLVTITSRCAIAQALSLVALRFAGPLWLVAAIMLVLGFALMVQIAATNTIIQSVVDSDKLGRVIGLFGVAIFGGLPVGSVTLGAIADALDPRTTFLISGVAMLACALVFARELPRLRKIARPLYQRIGLAEDG